MFNVTVKYLSGFEFQMKLDLESIRESMVLEDRKLREMDDGFGIDLKDASDLAYLIGLIQRDDVIIDIISIGLNFSILVYSDEDEDEESTTTEN